MTEWGSALCQVALNAADCLWTLPELTGAPLQATPSSEAHIYFCPVPTSIHCVRCSPPELPALRDLAWPQQIPNSPPAHMPHCPHKHIRLRSKHAEHASIAHCWYCSWRLYSCCDSWPRSRSTTCMQHTHTITVGCGIVRGM